MEKRLIKGRKQVVLIGAAALLAYFVSTFYCQLMVIQGQSMYPSYHNFQLVVLDKRTETFRRGDVVAFRCDTVKALLVKRIVAGPGDMVMIRDGVLYVNGQADMVALSKGKIHYAGTARRSVTLEEDEFFVLGDYYDGSKDSRYEQIGNVERSSIVGKVLP